MAAPAPPSTLLWASELPRGAWTLARVGLRGLPLGDAPRGDGRPIILLPGLFNSDRSMIVMRRYLRKLGYHVRGWNLHRNLGTRSVGIEGERLLARVRAIREERGQPVTLIGVSLGGMLARLAAHRLPDDVREVITISSPFAGDPRATRVWRAFEWFTGDRIDSETVIERGAGIARPLPVPTTAIWSASDGLVSGQICHAPDDPNCRNIEVASSHLGVHVNPKVLRVLAGVLAGEEQA